LFKGRIASRRTLLRNACEMGDESIRSARSMRSSMRWNSADLGFDGVDRQRRPAGVSQFADAQIHILDISTGSNRVGGGQREAGSNMEVMGYTGRLVQDHKTIADFRKDNGPAIKKSLCAI